MTHIQLQVGKGQQSVEQAFNNVQSLVRKCKDPALDADERDTLQEALQTLANRVNKASALENELAAEKAARAADVAELEKLLPPKELLAWQKSKEEPAPSADTKSGADEPKGTAGSGDKEGSEEASSPGAS